MVDFSWEGGGRFPKNHEKLYRKGRSILVVSEILQCKHTDRHPNKQSCFSYIKIVIENVKIYNFYSKPIYKTYSVALPLKM